MVYSILSGSRSAPGDTSRRRGASHCTAQHFMHHQSLNPGGFIKLSRPYTKTPSNPVAVLRKRECFISAGTTPAIFRDNDDHAGAKSKKVKGKNNCPWSHRMKKEPTILKRFHATFLDWTTEQVKSKRKLRTKLPTKLRTVSEFSRICSPGDSMPHLSTEILNG